MKNSVRVIQIVSLFTMHWYEKYDAARIFFLYTPPPSSLLTFAFIATTATLKFFRLSIQLHLKLNHSYYADRNIKTIRCDLDPCHIGQGQICFGSLYLIFTDIWNDGHLISFFIGITWPCVHLKSTFGPAFYIALSKLCVWPLFCHTLMLDMLFSL